MSRAKHSSDGKHHARHADDVHACVQSIFSIAHVARAVAASERPSIDLSWLRRLPAATSHTLADCNMYCNRSTTTRVQVALVFEHLGMHEEAME